jgi:hypothetical protein
MDKELLIVIFMVELIYGEYQMQLKYIKFNLMQKR